MLGVRWWSIPVGDREAVMRWREGLWCSVAAAVLWLGGAGNLVAQQGSIQMPAGLVPNMGPLTGRSARSQEPIIYVTESYAGVIEAAVPRNLFAIRFDGTYGNRQPTRAEYLQPKNGFPLIETKLDTFDFSTYAEYTLTPWFSTFVESSYRWVNPEVNENASGPSDTKFGFKLCTWSSERAIATILTRVHQPTARHAAFGTGHWSIEPGLLGAFRYNDKILLEGEFRYFIPINGSDFAGEVLRYGVGLSYGRRNPYGVWYVPVLEGVGWSVLNGKSIVASSPDNFIIQEIHGQHIINAYLGVRWGYGDRINMYTGYGRAFTGQAWERDFFRIEMRYSY